MKHLNKPTTTVLQVMDILKSDTARRRVHADIDSLNPVLIDAETSFAAKVVDNTLFEIPRNVPISARVDHDKMVSYYEYRLLKLPNGRGLYDQIYMSAPYDICPYCTVGTVKTVDHFLPKAEYSILAITPINLVPSCRDCNTEKLVSYPTTADNQTYHPYFDKIDDEVWIRAELMQTTPLSFRYRTLRPDHWDIVRFNRANTHFDSYNIAQLFSNEANREFRSMERLFKDLYAKDKSVLVEHLGETYNSCREGQGLLDWKTLMYLELSSNDWFLNGCQGINFFNA